MWLTYNQNLWLAIIPYIVGSPTQTHRNTHTIHTAFDAQLKSLLYSQPIYMRSNGAPKHKKSFDHQSDARSKIYVYMRDVCVWWCHGAYQTTSVRAQVEGDWRQLVHTTLHTRAIYMLPALYAACRTCDLWAYLFLAGPSSASESVCVCMCSRRDGRCIPCIYTLFNRDRVSDNLNRGDHDVSRLHMCVMRCTRDESPRAYTLFR